MGECGLRFVKYGQIKRPQTAWVPWVNCGATFDQSMITFAPSPPTPMQPKQIKHAKPQNLLRVWTISIKRLDLSVSFLC